MRSQLHAFSCAFISVFLVWRVEASCYYPDGTFPEDYVYEPCSGDQFTSCCIPSEGDQCLSNGLCYYPDGEYMFRGACTDQSWKSDKCFQHCRGGEYQDGTYDKLVHCSGDRYCCDSDSSTCCNDDSKVFTVAAASVIKDLATTGSRPLPIQTIIATAASDSTATDAAPTSTASSEAAKTKDNDSSGTSKIALIAGGIGAAVVLIFAVALVFCLMRRRYRKKLAAGPATNAQSFPLTTTDGFQKLPEHHSETRPEQPPDKSPRPVEVPVPQHSPAPPYHPPTYNTPQVGLTMPGNAVEMESSYLPPPRNQWGMPVYEAPTQPYRGM